MRMLKKMNLHIALVIFLIIYTGVLLFLAKNTVTWEDEMYTLHTTSNDLCFAIKESYHFEGQPPMYFGLLNLWRNFSDSLFFARVFSIVFTLLSGLIIFKICRLLFTQETTIITTVLFLLNPFLLGLAFDARLYALLVFFSASSIFLYYKAYLSGYPKRINIGLHAIISLLGAFTQYFFVFLLIAQAIILLQKKEWKKFLNFFAIHLIIALIFTINFIFIPSQVGFHKSPVSVDLEYVKNFFGTIQNFLFAFNRIEFINIIQWSILLFYVLWLLYFIKKQSFSLTVVYKTMSLYFPLFIIIVIIFLFITGIFLITKMNYSDRYMTIILPSLFLLFIFSLTIFGRKYFLLWFVFLLFYYLLIDINAYSSLVHNLDYEKAAEFIENDIKSDAPILFYRRTHAIPFQYYYTDNNKIVQLPEAFSYNMVIDQNGYLIKDTATLSNIFNKDFKTTKEFILLTDNSGIIYHQDLNYEMIDKYLSKLFHVKIDTMIMGRSKSIGFRVRKLTRKE
jgi:hypothetical protein